MVPSPPDPDCPVRLKPTHLKSSNDVKEKKLICPLCRLSIQALLGAPNPDDPLANDVAQNWKEDEKGAIAQAREWTRIYAN